MLDGGRDLHTQMVKDVQYSASLEEGVLAEGGELDTQEYQTRGEGVQYSVDKVSLGRKNTKTPIMQAVNTVNMALRQKGGGKKIPREVKDYFIRVVGQEDFKQAFINRFSEDEEFQTNYKFMLDRYEQSKHVTDESIRQFVKAAQK